jgi:hypothetical protein
MNNDIEITISHYPVNIDFENIMKKATQYHLNVHYDNHSSVPKKMFKLTLDLEGKQEVAKTFLRCGGANSFSTLIDGKLYTCSLIANIKHFNEYFNTNLEMSEKDYLDIHSHINYEQILDFLSSPPPFCQYCDFRYSSNRYEWEPSKKNIDEWT